MTSDKQIKFEQMGGRNAVEKITTAFYEKIYADPWLSQFFEGIPQPHIEKQQNDFMQAALGGFNKYGGKTPPSAHQHINITEEVYAAREAFLEEAFAECQSHPDMIDMWRKVDETFKRRVVKESKDECIMRYPAEGIRDFPKPR